MSGDPDDEDDEDQARARDGDPFTSHEAAASVERIRESQAAILSVLTTRGPCTDEEIFRALPVRMSPSGARTRRRELVDKGLVIDSGACSFTVAGRRTIIWSAVP